jgi:hypothetical protein
MGLAEPPVNELCDNAMTEPSLVMPARIGPNSEAEMPSCQEEEYVIHDTNELPLVGVAVLRRMLDQRWSFVGSPVPGQARSNVFGFGFGCS